MKFIKVKDNYGSEILLNIKSIAVFYHPNMVFMSTVHADGNGMIDLDKESTERVLKLLNENVIGNEPKGNGFSI